MLYKEWLDDWLEYYVKPTVKVKTYSRYFEIAKTHLIPKLGGYDLDALKPIIIQRFITQLMQSGNLRTGQGLSANSINGIIIVIKNSLATAFRLGMVEENAADKIKRPRTEEKTVSCFSALEQKKIEQAVMTDKRDKMVGIILCLYTGLRLGELLALEWRDIDFSKCELSVNKTCHDGKDQLGNYRKIIDTPKTSGSKRVIPVPKQIIPLLKDIKKRSQSSYVIANGVKEISIRSYQRSFSLLQEKLKISHHGFHALRHTFATRAIECGMDVKSLSEILGHKSPTVTLNRYVHSLMAHKKEYMNRLGKLF